MSEMTRGERKARSWAELAERYRLEAEVKVEAKPAEYWEDGGLKYPARVLSSVSIREPELFGDFLSFAWISDLPGQEGVKATTRSLAGIKIRGTSLTRKSVVRIKNEATFRRAMSMYDYREDCPRNVPRRVDFANEDGRELKLRDAERAIAEDLVAEGYLVRDGESYRLAPAVDRRYGTYRLPK